MKRTVVLLAALVAACSGSNAKQQEERIAQLEQQNTQLQQELKAAKDNVAALQAAMTHSAPAPDEEVSETTAGQAVAPLPANDLGGQSNKP